MTLGAFVEGLKKEFMGQFGDLSQQLRTMQRGNTYGNDYRINMQQEMEDDQASQQEERQSYRSSQYYGEFNMRPSAQRK